MKLLVVIVNYRTAGHVVTCLRSLESARAEVDDLRVTVLDNASGDDSVPVLSAAIQEHGWASWVSLRPLARNGGFAYGNNRAVGPALADPEPPDYLMLLNPDTEVRPGAISALLQFARDRNAPLSGPRLEDPDGTVQVSAFRFPSVLSELNNGARLGVLSKLLKRWDVTPPPPAEPATTDWLSGACMLIRRDVFERIGGLDESYFLYFEEVDFCRRAQQHGYSCWYVPQSRVVHHVGIATEIGDARKHRRRRPDYWFESRRRYYTKNHSFGYAAAADLAFLVGFASWRVRRVVQRKPDSDPPHFMLDFVRHSVLVKGPDRRAPRETLPLVNSEAS